MLPVEYWIRVTVLLLVIVCGLLLGLSLENVGLALIAVTGAITGYLISDHWKLFRLDGLLANIASVVILVVAMKDFFPEDSTGKLVSVANLLVYLQSVLMFQEKTPRLIWQILVLSLLQVVVAAIFSLDLEGGVLFLFYFFVAGVTLALQAIYSGNWESMRRNQAAARWGLAATSSSKSDFKPNITINQPLLFFDPEPRKMHILKPMWQHLGIWMLLTFFFTSIMFYMIPRHNQPWFGATRIEIATTGFSKSVDLLNRQEIRQSNQLYFRAAFKENDKKGAPVLLVEPPYFRGMALSSLVIEDSRTNWRAPQDRIHEDVYQKLKNPHWGTHPIRQVITLEENIDPLIYSVMPLVPIVPQTPESLEFCHEISALTRCRVNDKLELSPYPYELVTFLNEQGSLCESWPYISNTKNFQESPMSADPPQQQWLTQIEPSRYPSTVNLAGLIVSEIREKNPEATRIEFLRALESYFLDPGRFQYTLDFRKVRWTDNLDPIEDFVRNHRCGHCELFASALTLMLRSQDIPARLVVGFHGGDYNKLTGSLMVRGKHAHAWVEAYLRPEDCTSEMIDEGAAGPGGAWLRLDPTPASNSLNSSTVGTDAMDFARSVWQDYVLGMDSEPTEAEMIVVPGPLLKLLKGYEFENWEDAFLNFEKSNYGTWMRYGLAALILIPLSISWLFSLLSPRLANVGIRSRARRQLRQWVANAISLISPSWGQWILATDRAETSATAFYVRLTRLLKSQGLERPPTQTHREFARSVSQKFIDHPLASMIGSTVWEVSEIFNEVRFGKQELPADLQEQIELCLSELEAELVGPDSQSSSK